MNRSDPWLRNIRVQKFKVLKDLEIESFKIINIIGGENGSGKSTLLEAIGVLSLQDNPPALLNILKRDSAPWPLGENSHFLFHWGNSEKNNSGFSVLASTATGVIEARLEMVEAGEAMPSVSMYELLENMPSGPIAKPAGVLRSILSINDEQYRITDFPEIRLPVANAMQFGEQISPGLQVRPEKFKELPREYTGKLNYYHRDLLNLRKLPFIISQLVRTDRLDEYISALNIIIPDITQINLADWNEIYVKQKGRILPLSHCGGGAQLLAILAATVMTGANGLFLFEHFESEIHCSLLARVWKVLGLLAKKYNCQLFITTHSEESLIKAYNGLYEAGLLDEMQYIRLDRTDGGNKATIYTAEELRSSLVMNIDVR